MKHRLNKEEIKNIRLEIKFDIEKSSNIVKYDIWFTPDQESVYSFFKEFERYQAALGDLAVMDVHYITYPHFLYDPNSKSPKDDCLGSGLYCVRPGKITSDGALIVLESIRQKCVHKTIYKNDKLPEQKKTLFWNFMTKFNDKCIIAKQSFNKECSDEVLKEIGIPSEKIDECVKSSFAGSSSEKEKNGYEKILKNYILDQEFDMKKQFSITRVPSITINGRLYSGSLRPEYVFDAICASFMKKPEVCYTEGAFQRKAEGFSYQACLAIVVIVIAINVILFVLCKNFIKKRIEERINKSDITGRVDAVVNSYLALRDNKL